MSDKKENQAKWDGEVLHLPSPTEITVQMSRASFDKLYNERHDYKKALEEIRGCCQQGFEHLEENQALNDVDDLAKQALGGDDE